MYSSATNMYPPTVQVSWDPVGRKACLGSVVDQGCLVFVEILDKWATLVCRAWKVRLTLWDGLGLR